MASLKIKTATAAPCFDTPAKPLTPAYATMASSNTTRQKNKQGARPQTARVFHICLLFFPKIRAVLALGAVWSIPTVTAEEQPVPDVKPVFCEERLIDLAIKNQCHGLVNKWHITTKSLILCAL